MNFRQIKAIEKKNKSRIKAVCPEADEGSGIYFIYRADGNIRYGYVGQAKHLLSRLAQHLKDFNHIDLSIKKHGLYSADNPTGYNISCMHCEESELDELERKYIVKSANLGYQLYNHTTGGQDSGKSGFKETVRKGYQEGLHNGYLKARREVAHLFDKHLTYGIKSDKPNKVQERAKGKFEEFISIDEEIEK